jgi:hypothetical protein
MNISQRKREADGRSRRAGEEQAAGVTVLLARAVRLAGVSRSAQPTWLRQQTRGRGVGPRCQAAMGSRGAVQRMDQRPSIRRPRP